MADTHIAIEETAGQLLLHAPAPLDAKQRVATLAEAQAKAFDGYQTYIVELGQWIGFSRGVGGEISYKQIGAGGTSVAIVADVAAGGVKVGDTVPAGTDITALANLLFSAVLFPSFTAPTLGLTAIMPALGNAALFANCEAGERITVKLTVLLNKGSINGARVAGVWQTAAVQNPRSGEKTLYILNGNDITVGGYIQYDNYQMIDGANTFAASANYAAGPQPLDSKGLPYSTPLAPGTVIKSVTCTGQRGYFYGTYADVLAVDATRIRALAGKSRNAVNGTTFSVTIPVGAEQVVIAYPATLRAVSSIKHVEGLGAEVKGVFTETAINVPGANNYLPISYRLLIYKPAIPFSSQQTYTVTI